MLKQRRPYELQDVDGTPVTVEQARAIITEKYKVPAEVRRRETRRYRQAHRDQQAEKKQKREAARTQILMGLGKVRLW